MRTVLPEPWPPASCAVLHRTAELEQELYDRVLSPSVDAHVSACRPDPGMVVCW